MIVGPVCRYVQPIQLCSGTLLGNYACLRAIGRLQGYTVMHKLTEHACRNAQQPQLPHSDTILPVFAWINVQFPTNTPTLTISTEDV